eukprot:3076762-Ditylum_brightwellii.AAC.1
MGKEHDNGNEAMGNNKLKKRRKRRKKHGRQRGAKKSYKGKNKRKNDKQWKQKDIRGTVTDEGQHQPRQRKKTTKVTTECRDKQNKDGEQSKQQDMIRQT